jgi:hypothetical protein
VVKRFRPSALHVIFSRVQSRALRVGASSSLPHPHSAPLARRANPQSSTSYRQIADSTHDLSAGLCLAAAVAGWPFS